MNLLSILNDAVVFGIYLISSFSNLNSMHDLKQDLTNVLQFLT